MSSPTPTRLPLLEGPPTNARALEIKVSVRVDSVGKFRESDITVEGVTDKLYLEQVVERIKQMAFRPATLSPDSCAISAIAAIQFTLGRLDDQRPPTPRQ